MGLQLSEVQVILPLFNSGKKAMHPQKGFSLFEVVFSLMLATVLGLALLKQQVGLKLLLIQLNKSAQGSAFLDSVDEALLFERTPLLPLPPAPYHLTVQQGAHQIELQLASPFKKIRRQYEL